MFRAEELPKTCRGSFFSQNKFVKLVHLLVLLERKFSEHFQMSVRHKDVILQLQYQDHHRDTTDSYRELLATWVAQRSALRALHRVHSTGPKSVSLTAAHSDY